VTRRLRYGPTMAYLKSSLTYLERWFEGVTGRRAGFIPYLILHSNVGSFGGFRGGPAAGRSGHCPPGRGKIRSPSAWPEFSPIWDSVFGGSCGHRELIFGPIFVGFSSFLVENSSNSRFLDLVSDSFRGRRNLNFGPNGVKFSLFLRQFGQNFGQKFVILVEISSFQSEFRHFRRNFVIFVGISSFSSEFRNFVRNSLNSSEFRDFCPEFLLLVEISSFSSEFRHFRRDFVISVGIPSFGRKFVIEVEFSSFLIRTSSVV